jgi:protein-S-isoprenylcysteine O-methyltransferase Ste14
VRHPRYLQFLLAVAGFALIANPLVSYVILALLAPAIWLVVVLEERERRARFGPAYEECSRCVPPFCPCRRAPV